MYTATVRIKTPVGKKLELNFAHSPHYPLSLAFSRRPFLGVGPPSTGSPTHPSIVKCAKRRILPTFQGRTLALRRRMNGFLPAVLTHPLSLRSQNSPTLVLIPGSPADKKLPLLLILIEPFSQWTQGLPLGKQPAAAYLHPHPPCTCPSPSHHLHTCIDPLQFSIQEGGKCRKHRVKMKVGPGRVRGATAAVKSKGSRE